MLGLLGASQAQLGIAYRGWGSFFPISATRSLVMAQPAGAVSTPRGYR